MNAGGQGLLERESELADLDRRVDAVVAGEGGMVLIEGPAGIGKTRLLGEARRLAGESGMRILSARAGELEREFPFGVVRQLFEGVVNDPEAREVALSGAALGASSVFESLSGGDAEAGGFATLHSLYWLALNLAAEQPLFIEVDDIQWCDRPSLRFLAYLVRRVEGTPVLVAATQRTAEAGTDPGLLNELAHDHLTTSILPGPLSEAAVRDFVAERLGGDSDSAIASACFEATGGNPLLLRELVSALEAEPMPRSADAAASVRHLGKTAVSRSVLLRLSRLTPETVTVARAAAIVGDGGNLGEVAELTGFEPDVVAEAMGQLVRAEILRPDRTLGFVHPLVLDAVLSEMSPAEREVEHGRAARMLGESGAAGERVATHLLMTSPRGDSEVIELLREAGHTAARQGAADSAVAYFRRALEEGPSDDVRPNLLFELGIVEALTAGPPAAEHLEEALAKLKDETARIIAAHVLVRVLVFMSRPADAAAIAARFVDSLPPQLEDTRKGFEAFSYAMVLFDAEPLERLSELVERRTAPVGEGPGAKMLAASAAINWAYAGEPGAAECGVLAKASLAGGELRDADNGFLSMSALIPLTLADREDVMDEWDLEADSARRRGSLFAVSGVSMWRGFTLAYRGELAEAESSLRQAQDEFRIWGFGGQAGNYLAAFIAQVVLERGRVDDAWKELRRGEDFGDRSDAAHYWTGTHLALLDASGRDEETLEAADEFAERFAHFQNPAIARWRTHKAAALARLGRRDEAIALVEEELEAARRWGAPGTVGPSLRALGVLKGDEGVDDLAEAVSVLEASTTRLELAKALSAYGTALRLTRKPSDAREPLSRALELATACSADALAEHARTELYATGARPRREALSGVSSLTPSERRVADLAADGMTNREIAQSLFVTPKTVEVHLSNTYRKLGIRSRRELSGALEAEA